MPRGLREHTHTIANVAHASFLSGYLSSPSRTRPDNGGGLVPQRDLDLERRNNRNRSERTSGGIFQTNTLTHTHIERHQGGCIGEKMMKSELQKANLALLHFFERRNDGFNVLFLPEMAKQTVVLFVRREKEFKWLPDRRPYCPP